MSCSITLKKKGLRITKPRKAILEFIHDNGDHITAEDVIAYVHRKFPGTNRSTIYRTLQVLEENECVFKSEAKDRAIYHHAKEGHHHHLVCKLCGNTIDCEEGMFSQLEKTMKNKYRFTPDIKHLVMNGICANCKGERH